MNWLSRKFEKIRSGLHDCYRANILPLLGSRRTEIDIGHQDLFTSYIEKVWSEKGSQTYIPYLQKFHLSYRSEAVSRPWDKILQRGNYPGLSEHISVSQILSVFSEAAGELLILGTSNGNPTMLMFSLAYDLARRVQEGNKESVPVLIDLSSWTVLQDSFETWLADEIKAQYNIGQDITKKWISESRLVLLLYGLEGTLEKHRKSCLQAINQFHQSHGLVEIVVSSSSSAYNDSKTRLNFLDAVELIPVN